MIGMDRGISNFIVFIVLERMLAGTSCPLYLTEFREHFCCVPVKSANQLAGSTVGGARTVAEVFESRSFGELRLGTSAALSLIDSFSTRLQLNPLQKV